VALLKTTAQKLFHIIGNRQSASQLPLQARPAHGGIEFEVNCWKISYFILKKLIPIVGIEPYPLNELSIMVSAVCYLLPSHIFEWGTHVGKSARIFYETARYFNIDTEIHSIDLPDNVNHDEHPHKRRGHYVKQIKEVKLYQGDGISTALEICSKIKQEMTPFFYVDGDHEYESVLRELRLIDENIENANILLHDTFYQSPESGYNIGPFLAVREFLNSVPNKYRRMDAKLGLPGMTLLYQNLK